MKELAGQLKHLAATGASPDKIALLKMLLLRSTQINCSNAVGMAGAAKGYSSNNPLQGIESMVRRHLELLN